MKLSKISAAFSLAAAFSASVFSVPAARAQALGAQSPATCGCSDAMPAISPAAGSALGLITAASDDVLMSVAEGLAPAKVGAPLALGSRLLVGPEGSASILLGGTCHLDITANSSVDVTASDGRICVKTASVAGNLETTFSATSSFGQAGAAGGGAGITGLGGISTGLIVTGVSALVAGGVIAVAASSDDGDEGDGIVADDPVSAGR